MKRKIEEILDKLVAEVNKGRAIDDCLREYSEYADELRPLLNLVQQITDLPKPEPAADNVTVTIRKAHVISGEKKRRNRFSLRNLFVFRPMIVKVMAMISLITLASFTTVTLSASSVPGDLLYPVKILAERVQYFLAVDTEGKARLHVMLADRRTNEYACLFEPGVPVNRELLTKMLQATELAIDHIELLSGEDAAQIIAQMAECNHHQMALLEKTRKHACDGDKKVIEDAIKTCFEQHDCIECMQNPDSGCKSHCPCSVPGHTRNIF